MTVFNLSLVTRPWTLRRRLGGGSTRVAQRNLKRIFERFYRVDVSRSSSTGGTGLGLAIVKHILARHGATLHIESEPGSGSRFCCRFSNRSLSDAA